MRAQPRALNGQRTGRGGEGSFPVLRVRERRRGTRPYLRTGNGEATSSPPLKPTNLLKIIGLSVIKGVTCSSAGLVSADAGLLEGKNLQFRRMRAAIGPQFEE